MLGHDVPAPPRVRLEVRESRGRITSVRAEGSWPLHRTEWRPLYLTAAGLATAPPSAAGRITFDMRSRGVCFGWTAPADTEITGPMALRLWVEAHGADDVDLSAGVEKWYGRTYIPFEGSYGFGRDRITTGWLKASLCSLDEQNSRPFDPVPIRRVRRLSSAWHDGPRCLSRRLASGSLATTRSRSSCYWRFA